MSTLPLLRALCGALLISAFTQGLAQAQTGGAPASLATALAPVLAGNWRSDANKARDQYRHPLQTLEFFGVKPNSVVVEIMPGGASAWYAEVLAPLLRDQGQYIAANVDPTKIQDAKASAYYQRAVDGQKSKFAANPAQYGKAKALPFDLAAPVLGAPGTADVVLTFREVHNWADDNQVAGMFKAAFAVLKSGGVFGVEDHRAAVGKTLKDLKNSGYLPVEFVIAEAQAAGFKLDKSSEINANVRDTKDYPKGVWTLPPVLANGEVDRAKYLAIG
jgi:predicted methyltransferase